MVRRLKYPIILSDQERQELLALSRKARSAQSVAIRARIILGCAQGLSGDVIARKLGIWPQTVSKWRIRFLKERVTGLQDAPRPGAPVKVAERETIEILKTTLGVQPQTGVRWTTRSLAREAGLSQTTVSKVWRRFGIHADRHLPFSLASEPHFAHRVLDVVGLFIDTKYRVLALGLNVPEASTDRIDDQKTARAPRLESPSSAQIMQDLTVASELYANAGTRGQAKHVQAFLNALDASVPTNLEVELMFDTGQGKLNLKSMLWLMRHPRFKPRYAPSLVSWLDEAERWMSLIEAKQTALGLKRGYQLGRVIGETRLSAPNGICSWVRRNEDIRVVTTKLQLSKRPVRPV